MPTSLLTVAQAAERLGVSTQRVQALIAAGRLPAAKFGRDWAIAPRALDAVIARKPGRPRKAAKGAQP